MYYLCVYRCIPVFMVTLNAQARIIQPIHAKRKTARALYEFRYQWCVTCGRTIFATVSLTYTCLKADSNKVGVLNNVQGKS
jgi:hypothetical protein